MIEVLREKKANKEKQIQQQRRVQRKHGTAGGKMDG